MNKENQEKLVDIVMGDAVLALLHSNAPVSSKALLAQLRQMAAEETQDDRSRAITTAMAEVRRNLKMRDESNAIPMQDRNNVTHIFRDGGDSSNRKH